MTTKKIKFLALSVVFLLIGIIGYFTVNTYSNTKKTYYLKVQSELLQAKYDTTYKYFKIMANDIYKMYIQNQKVINLFATATHLEQKEQNQVRQTIYNSLKKNYKRLHRMGVSQAQFFLPNNTSFLRMHEPENYGDDVTDTKPSVVLVNKTKKPYEGLESSTNMIGLRFVFPIFDTNKNFIGSMDITYSTKQLLENLTDDFVYDSHILISKSIAKNTIIEKELGINYEKTWESDNYYIEEVTHKKIGDKNFYNKIGKTDIHNKIVLGIKSKKTFALAVKYNYQNIILTFLPISDAKGMKNIAYIVTYTESDYLSNIEVEKDYIEALFFTILSLLYLFSLYALSSQEKLKALALYDHLTKLPNRTLFMIEFNNEINRALRYKNNVALMFLDLDGFKAVNDTYGHHIGDKLLLHIAQVITSGLRKSDLVARLGGDEFTIILSDIKDSFSAIEIAQNIIDEINKEIVIDHEIINIGASIGISIFPQHSTNAETLIKQADNMMYESKNNGKNQVRVYNKGKEKNNV
jgi:diguanylate cyclase (GGDEF)-like protein